MGFILAAVAPCGTRRGRRLLLRLWPSPVDAPNEREVNRNIFQMDEGSQEISAVRNSATRFGTSVPTGRRLRRVFRHLV